MLCLGVTKGGVDFMDFTMGDVPYFNTLLVWQASEPARPMATHPHPPRPPTPTPHGPSEGGTCA